MRSLAAITAARGGAAGVEVVAAVDSHSGRAEEAAAQARSDGHSRAVALGSLDALLSSPEAPPVDAVVLMLPHDLHEAAATATLRAGAHVLLEKPIAPTADACERILAEARAARAAHGSVFMVAEQAQYWPDVRLVQGLIEGGDIGEVVTAHAHYYEALSTSPFENEAVRQKHGAGAGAGEGGEGSADAGGDGHAGAGGDVDASIDGDADAELSFLGWRGKLARMGGGAVLDGGQHWIRPLRMWMGEVEEVVAVTGRPLEAMEGESLAHAIFRFASGKTAAFHTTLLDHRAHASHGVSPWFRVIGTHGEAVVAGDFAGGVTLFNATHPRGTRVLWPGDKETDGSPRPCGIMDGFRPEMEDFLAAVRVGGDEGQAMLAAQPEAAVGELRTALAMYRSAASMRWERVWDS